MSFYTTPKKIEATPTVSGQLSRAWALPIDKMRERFKVKPEQDGTVAIWVVEAPWANLAWHSYCIALMHLRPTVPPMETKFHLKGATHEIWVWAMDPDADRNAYIRDGEMLVNGKPGGVWLTPMNFGAQFIEPTDEKAELRVVNAVRQICDGKLSPDTDFIRHWMDLFGDNMMKDPATAGQTKIIMGEKEIVIPAQPGPQDMN